MYVSVCVKGPMEWYFIDGGGTEGGKEGGRVCLEGVTSVLKQLQFRPNNNNNK